MRLSNDVPCRLARLLFAMSMAFIWAGADRAQAQASSSHAPVAAPDQPAAAPDPRVVADQIDRCFRAIEAAHRDVPRETFDVQAVVASAGKNPAALLAWVQEHTAWAPYLGALRGPVGVLMDRRGSSLDRATLLAELLRAAGRPARLARAELSEATAIKLRGVLAFAPAKPVNEPASPSSDSIDTLVTRYAQPFGLDTAAVRRLGVQVLFESERTTEEIVQRTVEQSATLAAMVWPGAGPDHAAQALDPGESAAIIQSLRQHWWVQVRDGETWTDLDPGDVAAVAGRLPAPAETIDWQPKDGRWPLEPKLCHEIELRVVVERWAGGRISEMPVLRHVLRPSELYGQFIALSHVPRNWPGDVDLTREPDPAARMRALASAEREWMPVLRVGAAAIHEGSFDDGGVVNLKVELNGYRRAGKSVGGAGEAAASALDVAAPLQQGNQAAQTPAPGALTAEWIEYEIRSPGRPTQVIRRQMFDVLGPAARTAPADTVDDPAIDEAKRVARGLSLLGQTEVLPLACQLSPWFVDDLRARNVLPMREQLKKLHLATTPADEQAAEQALAKLQPLPGRLYDLALARHFHNPHRADVYLDRLNILSLHHYRRDDPKDGIVPCTGIDVVANEIGVRPDLGARAARQVRMVQGVLDTNAEALLMDAEARIANAADLLASRGDAGEWVVLRDPADPALRAAGVTPNVRARVEAELARGQVVIIPRQPLIMADNPAAAGWWRVDPQTGLALGINGDGWGAAVVEHQLIVGSVFFIACMGGAAATGKAKFGAASGAKAAAGCALGGISFALCAPAELTLKVLILAGALGGGGGGIMP